ncbi:MAG: GrrA/OscA1 family cyclophane-containing rSAM-modified RiPP [Synechocystis sp.]|jgi:rSAM-associated Gly-rich repeat protein
MNSTQIGWTAFLVAIASLTTTSASAVNNETSAVTEKVNIETRIARIQSTVKTTAENLPQESFPKTAQELAIGWGNARGGGSFVNSRRGGWGDGRGGGSFGNINPWRNGWRDGGGFFNRRWPDGGGFINRW